MAVRCSEKGLKNGQKSVIFEMEIEWQPWNLYPFDTNTHVYNKVSLTVRNELKHNKTNDLCAQQRHISLGICFVLYG